MIPFSKNYIFHNKSSSRSLGKKKSAVFDSKPCLAETLSQSLLSINKRLANSVTSKKGKNKKIIKNQLQTIQEIPLRQKPVKKYEKFVLEKNLVGIIIPPPNVSLVSPKFERKEIKPLKKNIIKTLLHKNPYSRKTAPLREANARDHSHEKKDSRKLSYRNNQSDNFKNSYYIQLTQTFSTSNSSSEIFKKKHAEMSQTIEISKSNKGSFPKFEKLISTSDSGGNIHSKNKFFFSPSKAMKISPLSKDDKKAQEEKSLNSSSSSHFQTIYNRKTGSNLQFVKPKESKTENEINLEQLPQVPDENIFINYPKLIPYSKLIQTYSSKYLSLLFQSLFQLKKIGTSNNKVKTKKEKRKKKLGKEERLKEKAGIKNYKITKRILRYLNKKDLLPLAQVNKYFLSFFRELIFQKIYTNENQIRDKIWGLVFSYSIMYTSADFDEIYKSEKEMRTEMSNDIEKDLLRTLPKDKTFKKGSKKYEALFSVLNAYSNHNKKIGYAQGLNFIVAKLLYKYPKEEDAFLFLDGLITKLNFERVVGVENRLKKYMKIIGNLIEEYSQNFYIYLLRNFISHEVFTAKWLITLFSSCTPNDLLFLLWTLFFYFGEKFIFSFIIAIVKFYSEEIKDFDLPTFTKFMKDLCYQEHFRSNLEDIVKITFRLMNKKEWSMFEKEKEEEEEKEKEETNIIDESEIFEQTSISIK